MRKNRIDWTAVLLYVGAALVLINGIAMTVKYGWVSNWEYSQSEIWQMQIDLWFGWL